MSNNKCVVDAALFETLQNVGPKEIDELLDDAALRVLRELGSALRGYGLEQERAGYQPVFDAILAEIKRLLATQLSNNGTV